MSKRLTLTDAGFSLIEVMIAMLVITIGLIGMAQLVAVTTLVHSDARRASIATELGQAKIDELGGMDLAADAAVQITPSSPDSLEQNVDDYYDAPAPTITRRWKVEAGPTSSTRVVTVRVINSGSRQYGTTMYFRTILR